MQSDKALQTPSKSLSHAQTPLRQSQTVYTNEGRVKHLKEILSQPLIDLDALADFADDGVHPPLRPSVWQLLLGYLPPLQSKQASTLNMKRAKYWENVDAHMTQYGVTDIWAQRAGKTEGGKRTGPNTAVASGDMSMVDDGMKRLTEYNRQILRQIRIDIPRTHCDPALLSQCEFQIMLERILFVWSIRHPAAGYVQGINDLLVPLLAVFLRSYFGVDDVKCYVLSELSESSLRDVEADAYWCYTRFLDPVQDNYTFAQKGVQMQVKSMEAIVNHEMPSLTRHLQKIGIEFLQFSFRWMNCLLVREFPPMLYSRLLDSYFSHGISYPSFHVFTCAKLLIKYSQQLLESDFQGCMMFLQKLPTDKWLPSDMELFLSEVFILSTKLGGTVAPPFAPPPSIGPSTSHSSTSIFLATAVKKPSSSSHPRSSTSTSTPSSLSTSTTHSG
ncbi:Tre-2/Bub2/Cdc16 (TBC) D family protein [Monocercomonoides exilis]|uniref:Tre-2/Bub2/Cdc16 (TBC) D family protein n=1 Tax=Monocercomonoides exilis TaxID=2049356 RepID=UPI003559B7DE|nr:Tre-2/Bub2/Cdc16 (TBC) D family protein [Monocercomonoides exilis]|eukprot:MONOS_2765.1-p1 / transcript=MONOS_2765.1 / gene=MONOS_2765 / organism=Monocercomonoides_exilis_PA203 / gene_product=Tre-2/Bub2/Cdc16 (TBC) D family protein / transcript_product=Tre-2/Bub2/Cdc16 (TBC) D family protein / location=Mono_scaffold00059:42508-44141(-) / protein_length=444 / sequence_SO=supercontig / SO=protein_coding / is_pseudo=false